jgi:hypothetical protein
MAFNRLLSRQEIVDRYRLPGDIEMELFQRLVSFTTAAGVARYLESIVDQELHRLFEEKHRPHEANVKSFSPKEDPAMPITQRSEWGQTISAEVPEPVTASVEPLLVDEKEAGVMLGVSRRTVFDLNKQGTLRSKNIGKRKLYSVADLRAYANGEVV